MCPAHRETCSTTQKWVIEKVEGEPYPLPGLKSIIQTIKLNGKVNQGEAGGDEHHGRAKDHLGSGRWP